MSSPIGLALALILILVGMILKGGTIAGIISPAAFLMVVGGTLGVMVASTGLKSIPHMVRLFVGPGIKDPPEERPETINHLIGFAEKARREGLLALENHAREIENPFLKKGVRLVVDGTDPELVKDILETEIDEIETRHDRNQEIFRNGGAFAPTIGILATVLSLVGVLQHLDRPATLGPEISAAFLATFYGVFMANCFLYPVANHLRRRTEAEVANMVLVVEGVLSIQSGDNPRVLAQKLWSFVPPAMRPADEAAGSAPAPDAVRAEAA
jgi:chemotaxis protein MotA